MLKSNFRFVVVGLFVILFAIIRNYEDVLFYDPFLGYFRLNYENLPLPVLDYWGLFLGLCLRFFLNSVLSLVIIYLVFKNSEFTVFATILYFVIFMILIVVLFMILNFDENPNKMLVFYLRRFLIQPLLLMLFLPAIYFQNKSKTNL